MGVLLYRNGIQLPESKIQALLDFGLTLTQARVYLCLLMLGSSTAKMLTSCSTVSRQDVYRVLTELFELGIVEKMLDKPTRFRAVSVDGCLNLLSERLNRRNKSIHDNAMEVFADFNNDTAFEVRKDFLNLILISGQEKIFLKSQEFLESTIFSLKLCLPSENVFAILLEQNSLRQALKRKVKFQFLTVRPLSQVILNQILRFFREEECFECKFLPRDFLSFGVFDDKKIIFEISSTQNNIEAKALVSENPSFTELVLNYFEQKWKLAEMPLEFLQT